MVSSGLVANPWFWSGLAGLFLGLGAGEAARWLLAAFRGREGAARRSVFAAFFSSLAILSIAGLLVFPVKTGTLLLSVLPWLAVLAFVGLLVGLFPRSAGLGTLLLLAAVGGTIRDATLGQRALRGPAAIASITPVASPANPGGPWTVALSESVEGGADRLLDLQGGEAAIVVERLSFPPALSIAIPSEYYRVAGIVDSSGLVLASFPARASLLERLLPLPAEGQAEVHAFFVSRSRVVSNALPLAATGGIAYSFGGEGLVLEAEAKGGGRGD